MAKLIVLEGLDGSGKETQTKLLKQNLENAGYKVKVVDFPNYSSEGCTLVKMYLDGKLGDNPNDTNAFAASMFFAADRYVSYVTSWKKDYLDDETVIIANRYTTANSYHQISKMDNEEWDSFLSWLWDFEFSKLGLPSPDCVILLDMPESVSAAMTKRRSVETGVKLDIHEKDDEYLKKCRVAANYVATKYSWEIIHCAEEHDELPRSREDISADVLKAAKKHL